jgi:acyl dehydratase
MSSAIEAGRSVSFALIKMLASKNTVTASEKTLPPVVVRNPQSLEDLAGREFEITEWFLVAQERIAHFAEATEDRQWIHLDRARTSEESPYGTTIAHGFLTLSLLSHFLKSAV